MDTEKLLRKYAVKNALDYGEAQQDAVIGKVFAENPELKEQAGAVVQEAADIIADVNAMSDEELEQAAAAFEYVDDEETDEDPLPDLEDAEAGEVVVRFAPNPNGPPTLGSSRGMVINGALAAKYDGTLILRFDDTDPRTKRPLPDAYDWYVEDYKWLGYAPDRIVYSSKQFKTYYSYAEQLLEQGDAYICQCSQEAGQKHREAGTPCPHRNQDPETNLELWEGMLDGSIDEGDATLKIKTDMQHKNPAIRDWVAFRIIDDPDHPVTGDEYRVWPLLDFAGAIEDQEQGTTHIVRGKDLRASTKRQQYLYDALDWDYPHVHYWGRVSISGFDAPMSTSTLARMIQDGELDGWDDVRAPTVRALRKRGYTPAAIQEFWLEMGVSETDAEASMETLETANRTVIDPEADRYFFVEDPVPLTIDGVEGDMEARIPNHPEEDHGIRTHTIPEDGGAVTVLVDRADVKAGRDEGFLRLKDLCNVTFDGDTAEFHSIDHEPAVDRGAPIVQWVPEDGTDCTVHMPDGERVDGVVEPGVPEAVVQFVRFGFVHVTDADNPVTAFYTHS